MRVIGDLLPSDLLLAIHALVVTDGAPPGFGGHLVLGVQGERGTYWWEARLGDPVVTDFPKRASRSADAVFLIGEADALAILTGTAFPERSKLEIQGDWNLIERFTKRYLSSAMRRNARSGSTCGRSDSNSGVSRRFSSARLRALRGA
jgi:hypothetical protein